MLLSLDHGCLYGPVTQTLRYDVESYAYGSMHGPQVGKLVPTTGILRVATARRSGAGVTVGIDTTGCDLIVVLVSEFSGTGAGLTDSKSNSWTALTQKSGGGGGNSKARIYYCAAPTVGTSHTFTWSGGNLESIEVIAVRGAHASPFDVEAGTTNGTQPGSITPSVNGCLVVCGLSADTTATLPTINSSFATIGTRGYLVTSHLQSGGAYLIQGTAAAVNPTWSDTGACVIAAFKPAGGATTYTAAGSGGAVAAGAAARQVTLTRGAAGTATASGAAARNSTLTRAAAGGAAGAGAAARQLTVTRSGGSGATAAGSAGVVIQGTTTVAASGGAIAGGSATWTRTLSRAGAGTATTGGAGAYVYERTRTASGGATGGGTATWTRTLSRSSAGGAAGAGAVLRTIVLSRSGAGTATTGGAASYDTVTVGTALGAEPRVRAIGGTRAGSRPGGVRAGRRR